MSPVLIKKIPLLNKPISENYLGANKTWRGLIGGTLTGGVIFTLQKLAYQQGFTSLTLIDYNGFSILLGFLLGFGALFGDLVESYYKRKRNIAPGKTWFPWDQLDFVFGGIAFSCFIYVPMIEVVLILLVASPLLHLIVNYLGYLIRIKESID